MSNEAGIVRGVSWRDCSPWLVLFRSFRLAIGVQVLLLASLGVVVESIGWRLAGTLFLGEEQLEQDAKLRADADYLRRWPSQWHNVFVSEPYNLPGARPLWLRNIPADPVTTVAHRFVLPVRRLFDFRTSWHAFAFYLFGALGMLAVWGLAGSIVTRIAAVYLGREERVGLRDAFRLAQRKWGSHIAAPILPLLGVALMVIPMMILGWLMRLDIGVLVGGLVWLLVLLGGFLMMVLLLGLLFGWPLMWATIQTEGSDAFDAISRAYAYTFQCPLQYLFYAIVAALFGLLGWLLVLGTSEAVIGLSYWGASWGTGADRMVEIQEEALRVGGPSATSILPQAPADLPPPPDGLGPSDAAPAQGSGFDWRAGTILIGVAVAFVRTIASAFAYSYFWCAAAAVYLLLRSDADSTEMDDVYSQEESGTSYGLPPLKTDEAGVPEVADEPEPQQQSNNV